MAKYTKSPRPTWQKVGLTVAFLLIAMASSAAQALAEENFGLGADVEIKVERATQQPTTIEPAPYNWLGFLVSFTFGCAITFILMKYCKRDIKIKEITATTGAPHGGEKLG